MFLAEKKCHLVINLEPWLKPVTSDVSEYNADPVLLPRDAHSMKYFPLVLLVELDHSMISRPSGKV